MSKLFKIEVEPDYKKSIAEIQTFKKVDGDETYFITVETGWRWGKWIGEVTEETLVELREDSENGVCEPDMYEGLEMDYLDDGCWQDYEKSNNCTAEMLAEFEEAWDEDGYAGVEQLDWEDHDWETFINTGLNINILEEREGEDNE
jgi:hypothetical protein